MKLLYTVSLFLASALSSPVTKRAGSTTTYVSGDTARDVENGVCAPLTVIFARGTSESGNIGLIIGPPLFKSLSSKLNKHVALQGVNYPADLAGDLNMGASGAPNMKALVQQAVAQCPDTKIALSGYSQGGLVTHYALNKGGLDSGLIDAIVYFGDPRMFDSPVCFHVMFAMLFNELTRHGDAEYKIAPSGTVPASKIKSYCAFTDGVCELHTFAITPAHLSYGVDANSAADFIIKTTGVSA